MTHTRINTTHILRMQRALQLKPQTYEQLMLVSGLSRNSVEKWVKQLRFEMQPKQIYVADYGPDSRGRMFTLMFSWGNKPDRPRPGPEPSGAAKRMAAMRVRNRKAKS